MAIQDFPDKKEAKRSAARSAWRGLKRSFRADPLGWSFIAAWAVSAVCVLAGVGGIVAHAFLLTSSLCLVVNGLATSAARSVVVDFMQKHDDIVIDGLRGMADTTASALREFDQRLDALEAHGRKTEKDMLDIRSTVSAVDVGITSSIDKRVSKIRERLDALEQKPPAV